MTTRAEIINLGKSESATFAAVGDVDRRLATGDQAGGAYARCEAKVLPGGGPPPHVHRCTDESFLIERLADIRRRLA